MEILHQVGFHDFIFWEQVYHRTKVLLLELAAIKANRWYFTCTIFYGNKLPGDFRGKHRIVLCNISLSNTIYVYNTICDAVTQN